MNDYYVAHTAYFVDGQWMVFFAQLALFAIVGSSLGGRLLTRRGTSAVTLIFGMLGALVAALLSGLGGWRVACALLGTSLRGIFGVTHFTQLNGILAASCLGFAIIPILFSVAERRHARRAAVAP